ncbi:MAG: HAMP domain-containing histidine kinase [Oscillospiraceae bacterium]|jgi:signal transduction histidine kinase|nr:HAMP domain-containing histidine kinase [Oscillospiraceae bacterium]
MRSKKIFFPLFFHIVVMVFIVHCITILLLTLGLYVLISHDLITKRFPMMGISALALTSLCVGMALSYIMMKRVTKPYQKLVEATNEIAAGHFDTRLEITGMGEAERVAESFNKMAKELGGIETLRSDFIQNVAHEFKTPIASITGFAKLLRKDNISPENRAEYIDIIIRESERLAQLSSNVLMFSKLENQGIPAERRSFLLDEQLRRAILMLEPEWKRKHIDIAADFSECVCFGSEELLMQVWINLIGNAVKFTPAGGRIALSIRRGYAAPPHPFRGGVDFGSAPTEDEICVRISDNGVGMSEETMRHIFEKFYQGDKSHSTKGNGLGLPLVKRILEIVGGSLTIESEEGRGTQAIVSLNAARKQI